MFKKEKNDGAIHSYPKPSVSGYGLLAHDDKNGKRKTKMDI